MINQLLKDIYNQNIKLEIKNNNKLNLIYEQGVLSPGLKDEIKRLKKQLVKRLQENDTAREKGFLVYDNGSLYEYRYGIGAFLFIERDQQDLATVWRANYARDENKPYKIKYVKRNVPFEEALQEAANFVDWLKRKRRAG